MTKNQKPHMSSEEARFPSGAPEDSGLVNDTTGAVCGRETPRRGRGAPVLGRGGPGNGVSYGNTGRTSLFKPQFSLPKRAPNRLVYSLELLNFLSLPS